MLPRGACILALLAACAQALPPAGDGATVDCWAISCPTDDEAQSGLAIIARVYPDFDAALPLSIEWHAEGELIRKSPQPDGSVDLAIGEAPDGGSMVVTSWAVLAHEIHHVQDWREGTVDYNHADPPGLWTTGDDARIYEIKMALYAEGFHP